MKYNLIILYLLCFFTFATIVSAQEVHQDLQEIVTADIVSADVPLLRTIAGTDTQVRVQQVTAVLTSGTEIGREVSFENEIVVLKEGDSVYLNYVKTINGDEYFIFKDYKRHTHLFILTLFFVVVLVVFSRWHGVRALLSLALSIGAIIFVLVPLMLAGYNPALVSVGIAGIVLAIVLFLTHGYNPRSLIAFFGTVSAVIVTGLIAWISVSTMRLTGFGSDAAVSLNFATNGSLDFSGLLLGSIIIGILGMLDDVSITQVSVVQQLKHANKTFSSYELYTRAIHVGKDHIGSLVNTLALAYVGVSLPLVLLFARADASIGLTLNQEVVAGEIVRIIVGSIGLVLAVPLTTLIASWYFGTYGVDQKDVLSHAHGHHH